MADQSQDDRTLLTLAAQVLEQFQWLDLGECEPHPCVNLRCHGQNSPHDADRVPHDADCPIGIALTLWSPANAEGDI